MVATLFGGLATLIAPLLVTQDDGKPPAPAAATSTGPPGGSGPPPDGPAQDEQRTAYREVYAERLLTLRTPRSSECRNSFVDFDEGSVGSDRSRVSLPEESDLSLNTCASFGLGLQAPAAGTSDIPVPSAEECLEVARQGGIQTVDGYDLLKDENPIRRGTVLCVETVEGTVVRAVAEEVTWVHLKRVYVEWGVDYTFRTTAWKR
ncbi:hypothetical protein ACFXAZ_06935 [Streptomyces sp. NPDC059477]|uniref:hypothetical protein n=1 Tax=Streptomyces sp. NPDC059477 TaxID=3346847 RepID=UPI00367DD29B